MYESALRDGLTKAFNKKYFTDRLESEFTFALRHETPLTLVMFDIDHFKKVNDTHGHQAGDSCCRSSRRCSPARCAPRTSSRATAARSSRSSAAAPTSPRRQIVAERMRKAVEKHQFVFEGTHIPVTISVGVAGLPDPAVKDATELVARADEALYESKHGGRNRVTIHQS